MRTEEILNLIEADMVKSLNEAVTETINETVDRSSPSGKWVVDVKGDYRGSWEISVVRSDNHHGISSWGWFDKNKLLISHNGAHCRWPILPFVFDKQHDLAHQVCDLLNFERITQDHVEKVMNKEY